MTDRDESEPTAYGKVYVNARDGIGIASYHFVSKDESYISYESDACAQLFPFLSDGSRIPRRMVFRDVSWDTALLTFSGCVSFAQDCGSYERILTCDGVEKEHYDLIFSDDMEKIIGGHCRYFYPNASKAHQNVRFDRDTLYVRWHADAGSTHRQHIELAHQCLQQDDPGNDCVGSLSKPAEVVQAMLSRNGKRLAQSFLFLGTDGANQTIHVPANALWPHMGWNPGLHWQHEARPNGSGVPLLVAAILLEWPEGVATCVGQGCDVNAIYMGHFRNDSGTVVDGGSTGVSILRVVLSVRGAMQCIICRHVLDGRVRVKTFNSVKKKCQELMELDTRELFNQWRGPFWETKK